MTPVATIERGEVLNFCAWLAWRFGPGWRIGGRNGITSAEFREAKRECEALIGCRAYGPEYMRFFYGVGS